MPKQKPLKVCLVSPLPPPYGGMGHWALLVTQCAQKDAEVRLYVVDVAPRWRAIDDLTAWKRVVFGGMTMIWHVLKVALCLIRGCRVVHIATPGQLSVFRDITILLLAKLFRAGTLYHLHFGRVPAIAHANTREWRRIRTAMRLADVVLPLDITSEKAIRHYLPGVRLRRIPNCLDLERLPAVLAAQPGVRTVMYLGWVLPTKGMGELVLAWRELQPEGWKLLIVGPGDPAYQQRLLAQHEPANLEFAGEVAHGRAMELLASAEVLVLPSHTEGFPNVVMEAMAMGKAIVATSVGAIPEMLDGGCGEVFPPQQVDRLKGSLQKVLGDPELRWRMGRNAIARARSEYALAGVYSQLKRQWQSAAGRPLQAAESGGACYRQAKVCLVTPLPPPYGGIGQWASLISAYMEKRDDIRLYTVDVSPRWRKIDDLAKWKRITVGGATMMRHVPQALGHILRGCRIVHINTPGQLSIARDVAIIALSRLLGVRVVYHIRFGRVPQIAQARTLEWRFISAAMRLSHKVIAIDMTTHESIRRHLPAVDLVYLPNCVDGETLPAPSPSPASVRILLYIAWVIPTKGIEELLAAWKQLNPQGWRLEVIGPGDPKYQEHLLRKHEPDRVAFRGEIEHGEAMQSLARCDAFVLPSHTEGFPNVIVEAMAMGKPIVATAVGAVPEMLDGGCGVVVPPNDVPALTEALQRVMSNGVSIQEMAQRASARARSLYSLGGVGARLADLWHSMDGVGTSAIHEPVASPAVAMTGAEENEMP